MQLNVRSVVETLVKVLGLKRPPRAASSAPARPARKPPAARSAGRPGPAKAPSARSSVPASGSWEGGGYPGDYAGRVRPAYRPQPDGDPDPGEVVWAWVPYEEDSSRGKDRPVLLVGHDGAYLLGLMMTSKDRNNHLERDRDYVDIGSGSWDAQGRASEVKLDRVVRLLPAGIRREGAVLGEDKFALVAARLEGRAR